MVYYDDNYGVYEDDEDPEETRKFYKETQAQSVYKKCQGCGKRVKIKRDYAYCNSCADKRERGMDI